jgi:hypothetical protein
MAKQQHYSVKKLAPYTIMEVVYTAQKDGSGKHTGFERKETPRKITDGRLVMFTSGHSVRIEGGDVAVTQLMSGGNDQIKATPLRRAALTPEQAVERVLARVTTGMEDE